MKNRNTGLFALLVVGGYYAWRNRFAITEFLESQGINIPLSTNSVSDTVQSGVAKIKGKVEHESKVLNNDSRKAI